MQLMSVCHNSGLRNELCRHLKSDSAKNFFFPEKLFYLMMLLTLLAKTNKS